MQRRLMQGNEACVEAALTAGVRFFAGYPITPATEIAEMMAYRLPQVGGTFVQLEDEICSIAAVIGASLAGVKAMTATSGPGFTLMQENLGFAAICEIPCVIVNVQRGGPSTGLPTLPAQGDVMQSRWGTHGDHPVVVLAPATVRDTFDFTIKAINLSEELRIPVILLSDASIAHLYEVVELPDPGALSISTRKAPTCDRAEYLPHKVIDDSEVPPMAAMGEGYRYHMTSNMHDEAGFPDYSPETSQRLISRLLRKVTKRRKDIIMTRDFQLHDADIAVIAYGSVARSARQAVMAARNSGLKVGLLELCTLWPFPNEEVADVAGFVKTILVPEMNAGQVIIDVKAAAYRKKAVVIPLNQYNGRVIPPQKIFAKLQEVS